MRLRIPTPFAIALALALVSAAPAAAREVRSYDYGVTVATLDNGMDVIVVENHALPLTSIEICVKNGAYTEPPEFDGLSHLYEHMFFKSNEKVPSQEAYMERLRELGARWNGTTSDERVNYFMTVHRKNLREGVGFLRDALLYPLFKEEELRREWPVVLGEFDRYEADPSALFHREIDKRVFHKYYSRKNTIGDREVIFNATTEQMREIQRRYYVPNNSALVVAGDATPEEVFALAEEMFGDWPRSHNPHEKWPAPEHPPIPKTGRIVVTGPVKTASIAIQWQGPSVAKDPKATHAADVLAYILGQPDSAFQKALVDTGLVDGVGFSYYTLVHTGPISLNASTSADRVDKAWAAIEGELAKFDDPNYITDEQLASAKTMVEIGEIKQREQTSSFIHSVSFYWATAGLDYYMNYVNDLHAVTKEDIARFVREYVKGKPRIEGVLVAPDETEGLEFAKTAEVVVPEKGSSDVAFRAPQGDAPKPEAAVETEEFDAHGLRVVLRRNPANEIVVAQMVIEGGLMFHGAENAGKELVLLETLDKGSANFSKEEVNRRLASTASSMAGDARNDYSVFALDTLKRDFPEIFAIYADALARPLLTEDETKLAVERRLNAIRQMEQSPDSYIAVLSSRNFFKGHPYEAPPWGVESAVAPLTADDLHKLHRETFSKSRMKLFVVGDVSKEELTALIGEHLASLPQGDYVPEPKLRDPATPPTLLTEARDLPTNYIFGAFDAPPLDAPDYPAFKMAAAILDDRFFEEVRTKRNLTYAVAAMVSSRLSNYGVLYVTTTRPDETIRVMLDEVERIRREPVSEKELRDKTEETITADLMGKQTNASQAGGLVLYDTVGGGWRNEATALDRLSKVTVEEVRAAAEKYLKNFSFAVLGDPEAVDRDLFTSK